MRHAFLLVLPALTAFAQDADLPARLARIKRLDVEGLKQVQASLAVAPGTPEQKAYFEALIGYELVAQTRGKDPKGAEALLDRVLKNLEGRKEAESMALRGACLGLKIGFQPMAGIHLAPEAENLFVDALRLSPGNPRVLLFRGVHVLHTPAFFGGGAERAMPLIQAALKAAEAEAAPSDPWAPRWGKAESLAWLAMAQSDAGQAEAARKSVDAALALDPSFAFAKFVLKTKVEAAASKAVH